MKQRVAIDERESRAATPPLGGLTPLGIGTAAGPVPFRRDTPSLLGRREFLRRVAGAAVVAAGIECSRGRRAEAIDPPPRLFGAGSVAEWMRLLYDRIRAERLSPPVASRVCAYAGVTLYEAVVGGLPDHVSLAGQLNGMPPMPTAPGQPDYWEASGAAALATLTAGIIPWRSPGTPAACEQLLREQRTRLAGQGVTAHRLEDSLAYGAAVGRAILGWAASDGFAATRGLPYTPSGEPDKWVPTPPTFAPALEPHWGTVRPFALEAPSVCAAGSPAPYSAEAGSDFHRQALRVYQAVKELGTGQLEIALFWADNPGETGTPPGHWVAIENQLVTELDLRLDQAAEMYARVGVALGDAFIACWQAKYRTNVLRPVTYIRRHIDPRWGSLVMTPPFPEYPSGHSVASAAAAEVLTDLFGARPFTDRTHDARGLRPRAFGSFHAAASEAAFSRLYGGIHYPMAIEDGLTQGRCIGRRVNALRTRRGRPGTE